MTEEWNSQGYPEEYVAGFQRPDEEVVDGLIEHLGPDAKAIKSIVLARSNGGLKVQTRTRVNTERLGQLSIDQAVNWSDPGKFPRDYNEYARTFWNFDGPVEQQTKRAVLLAFRLGVNLDTTKLHEQILKGV